jgi:hypothetical protein
VSGRARRGAIPYPESLRARARELFVEGATPAAMRSAAGDLEREGREGEEDFNAEDAEERGEEEEGCGAEGRRGRGAEGDAGAEEALADTLRVVWARSVKVFVSLAFVVRGEPAAREAD